LEYAFTTTTQTRRLFLKYLTETPKKALLEIPDGFRNNIWWNIGHVVVTHQSVLYHLSGLPMHIDSGLVALFQKGTVPIKDPSDADIEQMAELLISTAETAHKDYNNGVFKLYKQFTTGPNITVSSIEDAAVFNLLHESLHAGTIIALMKLVGK